MGRSVRMVAVAAVAGLTVLGSGAAAYASGTNSGGVNSGGVNAGGTGGGGGATSAPSPCAQITSYNVTAGHTPGDGATGAIWTTYTVKNCSTGVGSYTGRLTYTNLSTGQTTAGGCSLMQSVSSAGGYYLTVPMNPGQSISCTLDNDWVPLATSFQVSLTVRDSATMTVLASNSKTVTTPAQAAG